MLKYILAAITAITSLTFASAETLTKQTLETGEEVIRFEGDYTEGTSKRLYDLAKESNLKTVIFTSAGGNAWEGVASAWVMKRLELNAIIEKGTSCMSACAVTVLGATVVDVNGILGFHPAYLPKPIEDSEQAFKAGQQQGMRDTLFYKEMGMSRQVVKVIHYFGSPTEFFIINNNIDYYRMFDSVEDPFDDYELLSKMWSSKVIQAYLHFTKEGVTL